MKIYFLLKKKNKYTEATLIYNRLKTYSRIRKEKDKTLIVGNSNKYGKNSLIIFLLIFIMMYKNGFTFHKIHTFIWILIITLFPIGIYGVFKAFSNKIILRIDQFGIFNSKLGQFYWTDILSIKKFVTKDQHNEIITKLVIQTKSKNTPVIISLYMTDTSFEKIEEQIKNYKDFNIYKINSLDD